MNPEDNVTEEGWRPLRAQCTPLIQASARAAADRFDGWSGEDVGMMCVALTKINAAKSLRHFSGKYFYRKPWFADISLLD